MSIRQNFHHVPEPEKEMLEFVQKNNKKHKIYWDKTANGIVLVTGTDYEGRGQYDSKRYIEIKGLEDIKEILFNYEDGE